MLSCHIQPVIYRYIANGTELTQTDGRGNTTTQATDIAGRTLRLTDAAGATTATTYAADSDQPATVTDALGNTARYRYDVRGRKVAEWGTAIQSPRGLGGGLDKTADGARRVSLWRSHSPAKQGEGTMGCARSNARSGIAPKG